MKFAFYTLGCKTNQYETQAMERLLLEKGHEIGHFEESCDGYVAGQTPVVFVGDPPQNSYTIPGFERYAGITGADSSGATGLTEDFRARAYFQYVLNDPALIPGSDVFAQMESDPRVDAMPEYPESGSVAMIDGVLVVKFS